MENTIVACVQQRMGIMATREEFDAQARRFLRQAQSKGANLVIFPELTGVMLAPPLISSFKLGLVRRADQGSRSTSGLVSRRLGRVSGAAASALGGGFRGSLIRLLKKDSDALQEIYFETFGDLAREYGTAIVGGSLYLHDAETDSLRNRAYLFDADGTVLGYQDKLNLAPDEQDVATPGTELSVFETRLGRLGLLMGRDVLYPELARLLAMQGAELVVGIAASPGVAQADVVRSALALRAEENQVFAAASFLLGPNHLGQGTREDFYGQSALLAPISLTERGNGVLVQAGTNRTEGLIAAELDGEALQSLWQTSRFRPRRELSLGNMGPMLAEMYQQGLTIEQVVEQHVAIPVDEEPVQLLDVTPEPESVEPVSLIEPLSQPEELEPEELELEELEPEELEPEELEPEAWPADVPESLSLTGNLPVQEEQEAE